MDYFELEPENNVFKNIVVDITHKCNMSCANCYIPNRDIPDMDVGILYKFLKKLPKRTYIRLIGAEPTMRDDIGEIIETVIKLGHRPSLTTNGLKWGDFKYAQSLKDKGLKLLLISMNGADDNDVYQILDNGKFAEIKKRALKNSFELGYTVNTGTIIAKNVNEHVFKRQVKLFVELAKKAGLKSFNRRIPPVLRFKSVGSIGRNLGNNFSYDFSKLIELVAIELDVDLDYIKSQPVASGNNKLTLLPTPYKRNGLASSYAFDYETDLGKIIIRLIDWTVNDDGVVDPKNGDRGRITQDWKIAPFFEHVKLNEFGY